MSFAITHRPAVSFNGADPKHEALKKRLGLLLDVLTQQVNAEGNYRYDNGKYSGEISYNGHHYLVEIEADDHFKAIRFDGRVTMSLTTTLTAWGKPSKLSYTNLDAPQDNIDTQNLPLVSKAKRLAQTIKEQVESRHLVR